MKKIVEILESTIIFWLPVLAIIVGNKLAEVVTGDVVIGTLKVIGIITLIVLFLIREK